MIWATFSARAFANVSLSLSSVLAPQNFQKVEEFLKSGGRFSLGIIPTARTAVLQTLEPAVLFTELLSSFSHWNTLGNTATESVRKILREAIYTPACGLALHSVSDADLIMELLGEFRDYLQIQIHAHS